MSSAERPFWKSPSFVGALLGAVSAVALDVALAAPKGAGYDFVRFLGRFHPLVVHLPIGFLLLVALVEGLTLSPKLRAKIDPVTGILLPPLVVSAIAAFALGLLLARDGGYPSKLVAWHRNLTLAAVIGTTASLGAWSAHASSGGAASRFLYRASLGVSLALVSIGAHFGGSITRGESYLTKYAPALVQKLLGAEPPPPPAPAPKAAGDDPLVYRDVVRPILEARCVECHGSSTSKASLRVDSIEAMLKGGENGPAVVPGRGADSSLVSRMLLPLDKDEHMPPEGKPGPSPAEIEAIRFWIDRGASDTLKVRDALPPDAARAALLQVVGSASPVTAAPPPGPSASATPSAAPSAGPAPSADASASASPGSASRPAPVVREGRVYADAVAPILAARCAGCHGAEKQKGKLRVDSIEALVAGGKAGPGIVAGDSSRGTLLARARLPLDDRDHMPPKKEPQLTDAELALVAFWIDHGATEELRTSALPANLRVKKPAPAPAPTETAPTSATPAPSSSATPVPAPATTPVASSSEPAPPPKDPAHLPAHIAFYPSVVKPMLDKRCGACHSGQGPSGDLDVTDLTAMMKSGALVPSDAHKSRLFARAALPLRDPDHMPPEGLPQTERGELDALQLWIDEGGADPAWVVDAKALTADVAYASAQSFVPAALPAGAEVPEPAVSAAPIPSSSAAAVSSARPSGPPSVEPGAAGCAACAISRQDAPLALSFLATVLGVGAIVLRRASRPSRGRD